MNVLSPDAADRLRPVYRMGAIWPATLHLLQEYAH